MDRLKKLRDRIDWLDSQIASLLNERMGAVDQVGKIKKTIQHEVLDPSREMNVLNQVESIVQHPILKANIANIYKEIMQESKTVQQFFQHSTQPFPRIGMIGLGLMGGSICKAIKTKDASIEIGALMHQHETDSLAKEGGWIDQVYSTVEELIQNSDLIILASPISTIIQLAEEIKLHSADCERLIVIDIASVKEEIVAAFEKLSCKNIEYLSTHPMAGKEKSGFTNSQATLFVNRPWMVVPHQKNSPECIESIKQLILFLGSNPVSLDAKVHDQRTALISHLPSILSKSYFDFVSAIDPESLMISGPGFQSFTRLAHGNETMRREIAKSNQQFIQDYLAQWLNFIIKGKGLNISCIDGEN